MTTLEQQVAFLLLRLATLESHVAEQDLSTEAANAIKCTGEFQFFIRNRPTNESGGGFGTPKGPWTMFPITVPQAYPNFNGIPIGSEWEFSFGDTDRAHEFFAELFGSGGYYYGSQNMEYSMTLLQATGWTVYDRDVTWECSWSLLPDTPVDGGEGSGSI